MLRHQNKKNVRQIVLALKWFFGWAPQSFVKSISTIEEKFNDFYPSDSDQDNMEPVDYQQIQLTMPQSNYKMRESVLAP